MLVVFDHGIIKTIENSTVSLPNEKHKKLKETGTFSKNSKDEGRLLKIEGDIPF